MTRYFWAATFSWPIPNGTATIDATNTFESDAPVYRSDVLKQVKQHLAADKMPNNATLVFFTCEIDEVT